jgi:hypothetical protein
VISGVFIAYSSTIITSALGLEEIGVKGFLSQGLGRNRFIHFVVKVLRLR